MATTPPPLPPRQHPRPPLPPRRPGPGPGPEQGQESGLHCYSDSNLSIPPPSSSSTRRRLLLVYVHGFNGSEASFQQFPAHVHSVLAGVVGESHELFTRIYPRYKSRGDMNITRDQFSSWLAPHEAPDLDIILLGHSLGGILTAEVSLLPSNTNTHTQTQTGHKHRILGLINYDVPFLGLHPGIIQTSAKGLFRKDQTPAELEQAFSETQMQAQAQAVASFQETAPDHFDPPFFNDVHIPERKGLQGAMHFVEKNYNRLTKSIVNRMVSPYQFAGCLNNYPELRRRYKLLMELEGAHDRVERVRFVNYYTDSELPPPPPPSPPRDKEPGQESQKTDAGTQTDMEMETETETEQKEETQDINEKADSEKTDSEKKEAEIQKSEPESKETDVKTEETLAETQDTPEEPRPQEPKPQEPQETAKTQTDAGTQTEQTELLTEKQTDKKQKRRKFILLPSHHWRGYGDDSLWVPINMDNVNEILAHQSIFIPQGRNYDQLVGDTVETIERWVQDSLTARTLDAVRCEEGK